MHDGCVAGYVCDEQERKCKLGAPGTGDTKETCEKKCGAETYVCDATTKQCVKGASGMPKSQCEAQCGVPPHDVYVCNVTTLSCEKGTGGTWKKGCEAGCGNSTPSGLVGLWRGWNVQNNFTTSEWIMNFTEHTVSWGKRNTPEASEATVAQISPKMLRLTVTKGPNADTTLYASFTSPGWPTGPETTGVSLAFQRKYQHQNQMPPDNTWEALGNDLFDVLVLHKCNPQSSKCDFSPAFKDEERSLMAYDDCRSHKDCGSCISDTKKVCGWCDGIVTFSDQSTCGADGNGCCGGSSGFSKCSVAYRKVCPVMCDWKNWTNPKCRPATPKELKNHDIRKFTDCETVEKYKACDYEPQYFYCDEELGCKGPLNKSQCQAEKRCNISSPACDRRKCKTPEQWTCDAGGKCNVHPGPPTNTSYKNQSACEKTCKVTKEYYVCDENQGKCSRTQVPSNMSYNTSSACEQACDVQYHYECDKTRSQCYRREGPVTNVSYNTSSACETACTNLDIEGVWRAININQKFVGDEWDFLFGSSKDPKVTYMSRRTGQTLSGTYEVGPSSKDTEPFGASKVTITLSSGAVLKGIFNDQYAGPIARALFLGFADKDTATFDSYMDEASQEFVLISCRPDVKNCDFSQAKPTLPHFQGTVVV